MKEFSETHNFDHIHTILVKRPKISPAASCQELLADASNETGSLGFSLSIVKTALSPLRSDNHTCHCLVTPALPADCGVRKIEDNGEGRIKVKPSRTKSFTRQADRQRIETR